MKLPNLALQVALIGLVAAGVVILTTQNFTTSFSAGLIAASAAHAALAARARRAKVSASTRATQIAELIAAQLTAGVTFVEALQNAVFEAPFALRPYLERLQAIFESDIDLEGKIDQAKRVLASREGDLLFELILVAARVGDDELVSALGDLSAASRRAQTLERELAARQSWILGTARLGQTAPWLIVILLSGRPETAAAFQSPLGLAILTLGLVLSLAAQKFITAGSRLPQSGRVFGVSA
jgi:tight adherence protein B